MRVGKVLLGWGVFAMTALAQGPSEAPLGVGGQPLTVAMLPETLKTFNPLALQLTWANRRWQIVEKNEVLKDFGPHEREARQALRLIQTLGINQCGSVGSPSPVMEYWLINGKAPQPPAHTDLRMLSLDSSKLRIDQLQGQWCLRDDRRVLFAFGAKADEAHQARAIIQKHGFSQIGLAGQGTPVMYVFFGRPSENQPGLATKHSAPESGRQMPPTHFSALAKDAKGNPRTANGQKSNGLEGMVAPVVPAMVTAQSVAPPGSALAQLSHPTGQATVWRQPRFGANQPDQGRADAERMPFDHRQVQMRQDQGEWKLMVGTMVLANFGPNAQDARLALSAIRHYHFSERWHVGGEVHPLNYYLANGQSPHGLMFGLQAESIQPEKVAVKQSEGSYTLVEGERVLLHFGERQDEAKKLLEAIQRDKFDRLCKLGDPGKEVMTFLVRSR